MTIPADPVLVVAWTGVGLLLILGTLLSWRYHRVHPTPETRNTKLRVRTWWLIVACLLTATAFGPPGIATLFCLVSLAAMGEFVALDPACPNRPAVWGILAIGTVSAYLLALPPISIPRAPTLWGTLVVAMSVGLAVATRSPRRVLLCLTAFTAGVVGIACVVPLAQLDAGPLATNTGLRLVFMLLLLTGLNDIAQYLWGKRLGGRRVAPRLSPNKTWAGLIGGVATTAILAAGIAPILLAERWPRGLLLGLLIGVGGFAGDVLASSYKRHVGAGASGRLLPGHGGIIDRIDSLCVTTPLLYGAVILL